MNKEINNNMVENKVIEPKNDEITPESLKKDLKKLELLSFFMNMEDRQKIEYVISRGSYELIDCHCSLKKRKTAWTYSGWKEDLIKNITKGKLTRGELYRRKQGKNEKLVDYMKTIIEEAGAHDLEAGEELEIILAGMSSNYGDIRRALIQKKSIDEEFLKEVEVLEKTYIVEEAKEKEKSEKSEKRIQDLEELVAKLQMKDKEKSIPFCGFCNRNGHVERYCWDKNGKPESRRRINEISERNNEDLSNLVNKENSIYIGNCKFDIRLDTGACYNFISYPVVKKTKSKLHDNFKKLTFFTCLEEEFTVNKHVLLNFKYKGQNHTMKFYLLPKVSCEKILIGREGIKEIFGTEKTEYECEINTEPGKKVVERVYQLPKKLETGIDTAIEELLEKKYISESKSTWLNNLRPVVKPNGKIRVTTNLVALNKLVELDRYSLPNIETMLYNLKDMKVFSKFDLKDGYFQVPLARKDRHKTAFRVGHKLYEWNVMPMGYKNAPAIFQRLMDHTLRDEIGKSCYVYIDDILIFGKDKKSHDEAVERILTILKNSKLEINKDKTEMGKLQIEFLGHGITENKILPNVSKVQAITDLDVPKDKKELQEILGLVNYYRKFIKGCSHIAGPLYEVLKKKNEFIWSEKENEAFNKLKEELIQGVALYQPDFNLPFILETDASDHGIGAILSQKQNDIIVPLVFGSRRLLTHESKYSISEKECLAILWALEHFKYFLYGSEVHVITDHKALEVLNRGEINSLRIQRWLDRMSMFNFTVEYRKGKEIPHVDCLSRNTMNVEEINIQDKLEEEKIYAVEEEVNSRDMEQVETIDRKILKEEILSTHEKLLHRGVQSILYVLKDKYPQQKNLEKIIKEEIKNCVICKQYNPKKKKSFVFVKAHEVGEKVAVDIVGPIENKYIITGIDYFSRYGYAKVISSRKEENVIKFIKELHKDLKIQTLILDQSKENLSTNLERYAKAEGIELHHTTPFHHQSNGRVERYNRTLQEMIYKNKEEKFLLAKVKKAVEVYNNAFHVGIDMTPSEAKTIEKQEEVKQKQFENILKFQERNAGLGEEPIFKVGDIVLLKEEVGVKKGDRKFKTRGCVVRVLGTNTYKVKTLKSTYKRHASQLKLVVDEFSI